MSSILQVIAVGCLVVGLGLGLGAVGEARHALRLWRARRTKAGDVGGSGGSSVVEVRGTARATRPLASPLSGTACLQFLVILERAPPTGRPRDDDPDLLTFVGAAPFIVDDGTGTIAVDLHARRVPVTGVRVQQKPLERLTAPLEKLLATRLGKPGGLWCHGRAVTATEAILVDGAELSVVAARTRPGGAPGGLEPLHITTGRVRVIALQGLLRATLTAMVAVVLVNVGLWLR